MLYKICLKLILTHVNIKILYFMLYISSSRKTIENNISVEVKRSFSNLHSDSKLIKQIIISCYFLVNRIIYARRMPNSFLECWSSSALLAFYYEFCSKYIYNWRTDTTSCIQYARVVPKSYQLEICWRSTSDKFLSGVIISNTNSEVM